MTTSPTFTRVPFSAEEFAESLINSSLDAIVAVDSNRRIVEFNRAAQKQFGYSKSEMVGRHVDMLYADAEEGLRIHHRARNRGYVGDVRNRRRTGEEFCSFLSATAMYDRNGRFIGVMGISRDISENLKMQEELQSAKMAAELANETKNDFLANVSHELRTPLTAILGFAENLLDAELPRDERDQSVDTIIRNGQHLLHLINDILDITKIESGKIDIEWLEVLPTQVIGDVFDLMNPRAARRGIELRLEFKNAIPETICTDPVRLKQILVNLVGNAIKFTHQGSVCLVTEFLSGTPQGQLRFDIIDTGIGIPATQGDRLFKPFLQADSTVTRRFGGTGLGLSISKQLAKLLGGDVELVDSEPGVGSRFRATIATGVPRNDRMLIDPAAHVACARQANRDAASAVRSMKLDARVLVAEDGTDNQRLIQHILMKAGADVTIVNNGRQAVEAAIQARSGGRPFDVILMDMQMPVMNGFDATTALRIGGYAGLIIALTAHAMVEDGQRCLEAGCDHYAAKPIDRQRLIGTIRSLLSTRS